MAGSAVVDMVQNWQVLNKTMAAIKASYTHDMPMLRYNGALKKKNPNQSMQVKIPI